MPIELTKDGARWTLALSGVVSVAHAAELAVSARAAAAAGAGEVVVRAAGVHALDTAALQILIALRRALAAQGRTLRVDGAPAALVAQWQRAGLAAELGAG